MINVKATGPAQAWLEGAWWALTMLDGHTKAQVAEMLNAEGRRQRRQPPVGPSQEGEQPGGAP